MFYTYTSLKRSGKLFGHLDSYIILAKFCIYKNCCCNYYKEQDGKGPFQYFFEPVQEQRFSL